MRQIDQWIHRDKFHGSFGIVEAVMKFVRSKAEDMGIGNSKSRSPLWRKKQTGGNAQDGTDLHSSPNIPEDPELIFLRHAIARDPELFVLNNLMMCIQFFGNLEEEMAYLRQTLIPQRESEFNDNFEQNKHVLLPDILQQHLARNLGFISARHTILPTVEPLQPMRIFVIHDNIEINEENYSQYSTVTDTVTYKMLLKPSINEGYVQLQYLEELARCPAKEEDGDLSSIHEDTDEFYSDCESVYGPKPSGMSLLASKTSLSRSKRHSLGDSSTSYYEEALSIVLDAASTPAGEERCQNGVYQNGKEHRTGGHHQRHQKQRLKSKTNWSNHNQSPAGSTSSGYRSGSYVADSDSDCSSNPSQKRKSLKQSLENKSNRLEMTDVIPPDCFKKVTYTSDGKIYDPSGEKKLLLNSKQRRIKLALKRYNYDVQYISSTKFMSNFNELFTKKLGEKLNFDEESIEDVKSDGCILYCDKVKVITSSKYSKVEPYEIVPAIWLEWPECAEEWLERDRRWPTMDDVKKIKDFGCYVIPEGFQPKKGDNPIQELEWQLSFPASERYLETCMSPGQTHVYLTALLLHKTFMRPVFDTVFGVTSAHIKNRLFWMIEESGENGGKALDWSESRTGELLLRLLKSIYSSISQNEPTMSDYFVRNKNLFQKVPSEYLLHTQKQLKRIIENPVMYVLHAMENIRQNQKFYPRVDYAKLFKILTVENIASINPALDPNSQKSSARSSESSSKSDVHQLNGSWDSKRTNRRRTHSRAASNKPFLNPRRSSDCIIEIALRAEKLDDIRLSALLDFFIGHFVNMADRCHQYRAGRQKSVYLDHAERLSILLSENANYKDEGRLYRERIEALRRKTLFATQRSHDEPPETPKRNLGSAMFEVSLKDRFKLESPEPTSILKNPKSSDEKLTESDSETDSVNFLVHTAKIEATPRRTSPEQSNSSKKPVSLKLDERDLSSESTYI
ncbi:uncharacterized protein [Prorops nasuta]|uniref:uncharacterized protein n=1 Tax=Prorops nasuta TaxID=863751 RepID=UPI0034CD2AF2